MSEKWPELSWVEISERVAPLVYRVYAGKAAGTAFAISLADPSKAPPHAAILATALHVIASAAQSGDDVCLVSYDGARDFDTKRDKMHVQQLGAAVHDTVMIRVESDRSIVDESQLLPMLPWDCQMARGSEVAWLGFPGLVEPELCFFSGHVSGFIGDPPTYLVDGVAINGVSGGPAFDRRGHIIGVVSAYIPNKVDQNTTLPGLLALVPINSVHMFMQANMRAAVL